LRAGPADLVRATEEIPNHAEVYRHPIAGSKPNKRLSQHYYNAGDGNETAGNGNRLANLARMSLHDLCPVSTAAARPSVFFYCTPAPMQNSIAPTTLANSERCKLSISPSKEPCVTRKPGTFERPEAAPLDVMFAGHLFS